MAFSFRGGIHPDYQKEKTAASVIVSNMPQPEEVVIPLSQHIGVPCEPLVKVGDRVLEGQMIGDCQTGLSAPIHASITGKVKAIEPHWTVTGIKAPGIVIENDGSDEKWEEAPFEGAVTDLSPDEIIAYARNAGIVGMGGAAFPTHAKLRTALDRKVSTVIINGCECEPFITADHRAMVEYPRFIVTGAELIRQCLGVDDVVICVESNKPDALATMRATSDGTGISVLELPTKYPQGGEKQLIRAVTGREVPPGKLPMDIGCAVFNVDTCASLYRAIYKGQPLIKRVVTVSGSAVASPANLLVRIGTAYRDLFKFCGGFTSDPYKIITGGPMMGSAQHSVDIPVVKNTSSLLAFAEDGGEEGFSESDVCIRCGRCMAACPMRLQPTKIYENAVLNRFGECAKLNVQDCIECGCCAYVCPAKLYLVQAMRMAKSQIPRGGVKK
ncbi:MAG: electron transport complex subunit RsxC [Clostridia bacterium]|nr:electron transport complex subunit RsxC [Clostridia bacterium]